MEQDPTLTEKCELKSLPGWRELKDDAIRLGLDGIEIFNEFTDEEIEKAFNYIGPDRFPEKLRLALSYLHRVVLPAVLIHDLDYTKGGTKTEFHQANKRLKKNMKKCVRANRKDYTWVGYQFAKVRIWAAYRLCEKYGYEGWPKEGATRM